MSNLILSKFFVDSLEETQEGFLTGFGTFTATGVSEYTDQMGLPFSCLRQKDEVLNYDSLESFKNLIITYEHPTSFLTNETAKDEIIGFTGNDITVIDIDGEKAIGSTFKIIDKKAIKTILNGEKKQFSCGYICNMEHNPGIYKDKKYDFVHKDIKYNHVALTSNGRLGDLAKIFLDSKDQPESQKILFLNDSKDFSCHSENIKVKLKTGDQNMQTVKIKLKDSIIEIPEQFSEIVSLTFENQEKEINSLKNEIDQVKKLCDSLQADLKNEDLLLEKSTALIEQKNFCEKVLGEVKDSLLNLKKLTVQKLTGKTYEDQNALEIAFEVSKSLFKDSKEEEKNELSKKEIVALKDSKAERLEKIEKHYQNLSNRWKSI